MESVAQPPAWATRLALGEFTDPHGYARRSWARKLVLACVSALEPRCVRDLWAAVSPVLHRLPSPWWEHSFPELLGEQEQRAEFYRAIDPWLRQYFLGPGQPGQTPSESRPPQAVWVAPAAEATALWWAEARRAGTLGDALTERYAALQDIPWLSADFLERAFVRACWVLLSAASLEDVPALLDDLTILLDLHPYRYTATFPIEGQTFQWNPLLEARDDVDAGVRSAVLGGTGHRLSAKRRSELDSTLDTIEVCMSEMGALKVGRRVKSLGSSRSGISHFVWLVKWQVGRLPTTKIAELQGVTRQAVEEGAHSAARLAGFSVWPHPVGSKPGKPLRHRNARTRTVPFRR